MSSSSSFHFVDSSFWDNGAAWPSNFLSSAVDAPHLPVVMTIGMVIIAVGVAVVAAVQLFTDRNIVGRCLRFWKQLGVQEKDISRNVSEGIDEYNILASATAARTEKYQEYAIKYYDLSTVFYEWGWGHCFHFSNRHPHETFDEGLRRHQYMVASHLGVSGKDKKVLDVGCGIGGPMRNISKFLNSQVIGITNSAYHVKRGTELNEADPHCATMCKSIEANFMNIPFEKGTFDAAFSLEATPHAPDKKACYQQIFNVLKPGAIFVLDEWCMTDLYDPKNPEHNHLKMELEKGSALPNVPTTRACLRFLEEVGFEVLSAEDIALQAVDGIEPWFAPFLPSWNPLTLRFQFTWLGTFMVDAAIKTMEFLRIAPAGTMKTQKMLKDGGVAISTAGVKGIFTGTYIVVARKPAE